MPKKSRKNKTQNTKEKKAIATRLMIINLKLDDYIYKNKPISEQEAKAYIEEIERFKLQCSNDIRSLQVIDKLTLFMKNIIQKSNSQNADNLNIASNKGDDSTQNIIDVPNISDNINYNRQDNKEYAVNELSEVVFNNNVYIDTKTLHTDEKNGVDKGTSKNSLNSSEDCHNTTSNKALFKASKGNICTDLQDTNEVNITEPIEQNNFPQVHTPNEKTQVSADCSNNIVNVNENLNISTDQKIYNKKSKSSKVNKGKNEIVTNGKVEKKTNPRKLKVNKDATIKKPKKDQAEVKNKTFTKRNKKNKDKPKNSNSGIGNGNTNKYLQTNNEITDLSWVENIKYVREVCNEEYDRTLNNFEESFWVKSTLPVDWNFKDFDYSD